MKTGKKIPIIAFCLWIALALTGLGTVQAAPGAGLVLYYGYPQVSFQIYQVADSRKNLTEAFQDDSISLDQTTNAQWQALAIELEELAEQNQIEPTGQETTGENGKAEFSGLQAGWYLVSGSPMTIGGIRYKAVPFVVSLAEGTSVKADVKHSPVPEEPEEPSAPGGSDDDDDHGGSSQGGSDGGASITDSQVPLGPGMTQAAPEGELTEILPEDVPMARLPQTGQLWWPVPVMAAAGVFLLAAGILRRRKGTSPYEEKKR